MRISYSDEENFPGQFDLWQANCDRSLQGKKGQAALRELEAALLALTDKRLIADGFQNADGEVCALAALAQHKGISVTDIKSDPEYEMEEVGVELGMPRLVAWKIVELNDVELADCWDRHLHRSVPLSAEIRYERVLAWTQRQLGKSQDTTAPTGEAAHP